LFLDFSCDLYLACGEDWIALYEATGRITNLFEYVYNRGDLAIEKRFALSTQAGQEELNSLRLSSEDGRNRFLHLSARYCCHQTN
jgi:hypothetical protein